MDKGIISDLKLRCQYEEEFDSSIVKFLLEEIEKQQQEIKKLNNEIGGYSGKVQAISEELSFLSSRLNKLQKEMVGQG